MATKWGIVSTGNVANDFVTVLNSLPKEEHVIQAVAARKLEDAEKFAKTHNISKAYGSYEELAKDPDIEVVYVGSVSVTHLSVAKLMISYGKSVLCEKPLGVNVAETREIIEFAKESKVFLMEAIWSRCFPVYKRLREELQKGTVGDIWQVLVSFGVSVDDNHRLKKKDLGGGSMIDLGIFCVQFCQLIFGGEKPECVQASGFLNDDGVDVAISATLKYSANRIATLNTHTQVQLPSEAYVVGTKGTIKIPYPFWCPNDIIINREVVSYPFNIKENEYLHINSAGMMYEADEVRRCLKEGLVESPLITQEETLMIAEIMETLRKQVGVQYSQDRPQ